MKAINNLSNLGLQATKVLNYEIRRIIEYFIIKLKMGYAIVKNGVFSSPGKTVFSIAIP